MKFCPEDILFGQTEKETIMEKIIKWCDEKISFLKQNKIQFVNGIPVIPEEMLYTDIPDMIDTFAHRNEIPSEIAKKSLISYFDDDTNLINRLLNVDDEISVLKQYGGICGFDLSPCVTMMRPRQKLSLLVSAVYNCYVALYGIKILPNCRVGDLATMSVINGIPPYTNIVTGELGCHGNKLKMYGLYQLRLIIKQVCPTIQFVYGNLSKKDIRYICGRNEQLFIMYPDHRHRKLDNKVPMVFEWNGMSYQKLLLKDYLTERSF